MMTARQILLLFGFFLSMFYIFKYGSTTTTERQNLDCTELHYLQAETLANLTPLVRSDLSGAPFDAKVDAAMKSLQKTPGHTSRQNRIWKLQNRLAGYSCPAPNMGHLVKLAAKS